MSDLVVITFKDQEAGRNALAALKDTQKAGGLSISDVEMVERDAAGKIHHIGEVDRTTKTGAVGGGVLGLLIGLVFFPVLGLAIGAIAGGLIGKSLGHNVDKKLVQDVTADLEPGSSAIFMLIEGSAAALTGLLRPFEGKVYLSTLDPDLENQLKEELSKGS
ncbi:MAG: DUF1269 domain-containing protein [Chloroflexota bacterium]